MLLLKPSLVTKRVAPQKKRAVASQQCGISPAKVADVRMKNLEQLKFLQQLYEDGILSHAEFIEQKGIILDSLRKLN